MRARRHARQARDSEVDPFYDMLFNLLIAFVFCFIVALLAMNPTKSKAGDVPAKAEFIVTLGWADNDPNDIDIWVRSPAGDVVWFRNREAGLMHLDRDDRGLANDTIVVDGRTIVNPLNQEVVTIRGIAPGEYTVNAHYYRGKEPAAGSGGPVDVHLSVMKINPRAEVVFHGQHRLAQPDQEATLVRFSVQADGSVSGINTLPAQLVQRL